MVQLILAQIAVCIIQYYIATTEKIKNIFWVTFLFNFANLICYFFNGDISTVLLYILICIRTFVYIFRDKLKLHKWSVIISFGFIAIQLVVGFATMTSYWQIIPILTPCYVCYYMWFYETTQKLRIGNIIGNANWCVYNTVTGLYIVAIGRLVTVIMNLVTYIKRRNE